MNFPFPIVIFTSNRTNYLNQVLESLSKQSLTINWNNVYIFSDGNIDPRNGNMLFESKFEETKELFNRYGPKENVLNFDKRNMGIAYNRLKAEYFSFGVLGYEWVLFCEDDLVFSDVYVERLMNIYNLVSNKNHFSLISAYGNLSNSLIKFNESFSIASHSWASLESKRYWEISLPILEVFNKSFEKIGYNNRDSLAIKKIYDSCKLGWKFPNEPQSMTSQDNLRTALKINAGGIRLNTSACYAHYIGKEGTNFNSEDYELQGFGEDKRSISTISSSDYPTQTQLKHHVLSVRKFLRSNYTTNYEFYSLSHESNAPLIEKLDNAVTAYKFNIIQNFIDLSDAILICDDFEGLGLIPIWWEEILDSKTISSFSLCTKDLYTICSNSKQVDQSIEIFSKRPKSKNFMFILNGSSDLSTMPLSENINFKPVIDFGFEGELYEIKSFIDSSLNSTFKCFKVE